MIAWNSPERLAEHASLNQSRGRCQAAHSVAPSSGSPRTDLRPWGDLSGSPRTGLRPYVDLVWDIHTCRHLCIAFVHNCLQPCKRKRRQPEQQAAAADLLTRRSLFFFVAHLPQSLRIENHNCFSAGLDYALLSPPGKNAADREQSS